MKEIEEDSNRIERNEFCECKKLSGTYSDTESTDFGYWDVCLNCDKKIEFGFHYYNHYDGKEHDDIELYEQ